MIYRKNNIIIECQQGDITAQPDLKAIVNAANARLLPGGGVAGAIHRAAGPGLARECRPFAPIRPGQAVITSGHNLPNDYVIHCLGPVYGVDKPEEKLLASCYQEAVKLADQHKINSIGFPAISTGAFGYPMQDAAQIAFKTIFAFATSLQCLEKIRFVLFNNQDLKIHEEVLSNMIRSIKDGAQ